ncbi:hypothetical protein LTR36_009940 [Oleoguttula mirabilis]|uniref:Uncharacterized protein n=1 Tax=Oleoguttula mirabilis TaxID=1507867 RepID=A0AAV9J5K3_9PEZI|nr:hypothetical protein LTR36_009940 [Oleoguttula mirabilis]
MARKRSAAEIEAPADRSRRADAKRTRMSPADDVRDDSSAPSSCSVSEDSALRSSPAPSDHTRHSSFSSAQSGGDDDSESSLSSSSDESSDEDSGDANQIITVGGPKKPQIAREVTLNGAQDLQARIAALLPQLAAANSNLDKDGAGHSMEDVEEGEQHIEMNLGLGVLEEKQGGDCSSSEDESENESESGSELSDGADVPTSSAAVMREQEGRVTHVMGKLLGQRTGRRRAGIEDLG